ELAHGQVVEQVVFARRVGEEDLIEGQLELAQGLGAPGEAPLGVDLEELGGAVAAVAVQVFLVDLQLERPERAQLLAGHRVPGVKGDRVRDRHRAGGGGGRPPPGPPEKRNPPPPPPRGVTPGPRARPRYTRPPPTT